MPFRHATAISCHRCPRDGSELAPRKIGGDVLHACRRCGGVWIDHDVLARLRADAGLRERIADDPCAHAPRPAAGPDVAPPVRCPSCGAACARHEYARATFIEVDECGAHGVWMDAGELFVALYHEGLAGE